MQIKVPKEIQIGTLIYKVYLDESLDDAEYDGSAFHSKLQIRINPAIPDARKALSLLHEIIHTFSKPFDVFPNDREINLLSTALGEFLFNNLGIEFDWSDIPTMKLVIEETQR